MFDVESKFVVFLLRSFGGDNLLLLGNIMFYQFIPVSINVRPANHLSAFIVAHVTGDSRMDATNIVFEIIPHELERKTSSLGACIITSKIPKHFLCVWFNVVQMISVHGVTRSLINSSVWKFCFGDIPIILMNGQNALSTYQYTDTYASDVSISWRTRASLQHEMWDLAKQRIHCSVLSYYFLLTLCILLSPKFWEKPKKMQTDNMSESNVSTHYLLL